MSHYLKRTPTFGKDRPQGRVLRGVTWGLFLKKIVTGLAFIG